VPPELPHVRRNCEPPTSIHDSDILDPRHIMSASPTRRSSSCTILRAKVAYVQVVEMLEVGLGDSDSW